MKTFAASTRIFNNRAVFVLVISALFASCQRNLTKNTETGEKPEQMAAPATSERFVKIDTATLRLVDRLEVPSSDSAIVEKVKRFYETNALMTKWLESEKPAGLFNAFVDQLKNSTAHGLEPAHYRVEELEQKVKLLYAGKAVDPQLIMDLDVEITQTFFLFTSHLHFGKIKPAASEKNTWIRVAVKDTLQDVIVLRECNDAREMATAFETLLPVDDQYKRLQKALSHYRSLERSYGNLKAIRVNEKIQPGERRTEIPAIRKKLSLMTDVIDESRATQLLEDSLLYDETLVVAIKGFQRLHGLFPDGIIGGNTLKNLNRSFKEKADLIALNMERLRWSSSKKGEHHISVNIPEYKLRIFERQGQTLEMDVIVGAIHTKTPVFHDTLEFLVLSPTWTIPPSIMKQEIFPRLKKDSSYYSEKRSYLFYRNGVQIDPAKQRWDTDFNVHEFRVVQKPGYDNALGLAKFVMPNALNIYLHDTPDHSLFSKTYRALSHGCIRLSEPARLAVYLLQEESAWNLPAIEKAMKSSTPTKVLLKKQYPVFLEYKTVWIDGNDQVNFREDIYGHDKRQLQQMHQQTAEAIATL